MHEEDAGLVEYKGIFPHPLGKKVGFSGAKDLPKKNLFCNRGAFLWKSFGK